MADEPKAKEPEKVQDVAPPSSAALSPAPTVVAGETGAKTAPDPNAKVQAEPLSDGTTPVVLTPGSSHRSVPKGKASITNIYRRADVTTTLLSFVGALVAAGVILGGYWFFARTQTKPTTNPKVTNLDKAELEKLGAFFEGNSAGKSSQVLTINSSTLFSNRVAVSSDLKVVGGVQVSGTTALGDLTVDKTSTLGVTNVRGSLTVAGPLNVQSPAVLGGGGTVTGNLSVSGNGNFGGSISAGVLNVRDISVTGTLNVNGHLNISGSNPSAAPASGVVSSATVNGTDTAGTVTISMTAVPSMPLGANLATITFRRAFPNVPNIVITPVGRGSAMLRPFVLKTATNFIIGAAVIDLNNNATSYSFDYWAVQ